MRIWQGAGLAALTAASLLGVCQKADAGVGIGVGFGGCCRPGWRVGVGFYFPGYYYDPYYPYYVVPPPPVVVQPAPVVVQPAYPPPPPNQTPEQVPAPSLKTATTAEPPIATPVSAPAAGVDAALARLSGADAQARADAAIELGRQKERRAVEPLMRVLRNDTNPTVRETAARALGLIADPASLSALQYAAQADDDREVRHSAQFAAEGIRANLRR